MDSIIPLHMFWPGVQQNTPLPGVVSIGEF